ncbi:MAG TPA: hypothetical protein VH500_23075 [Nitrososphaeraceae archaeon]|jgi:hypothetical protein
MTTILQTNNDLYKSKLIDSNERARLCVIDLWYELGWWRFQMLIYKLEKEMNGREKIEERHQIVYVTSVSTCGILETRFRRNRVSVVNLGLDGIVVLMIIGGKN